MSALDGRGLEAIFEAPAPLTVGVEEELMLLDPDTLDLAPRATELVERTGHDGRFKIEMPSAQFEIASPVLRNAAAAAEFLLQARRDLAAAGDGLVRLACSGVHPFADEEGPVNAGERYTRVVREYGPMARRQLVFGLQVHVAVRGAGRALAVYNGLRERLPELLALAANAPFYRGRDTGLATVRPKLCQLLPRQGVPPPIASWEEHAQTLAWGARAGAMPAPGVWWWELRPHPSFGTLEVRVPDAQRTVAESAAIVATVHALAAFLADRHDAAESARRPPAPTWRIEENRWQALRHGLDGTLADLHTGEPTPTRERLHALLDTIAPHARTLDCEAQLATARTLAERNGAERQREVHASAGMSGLLEWMIEGFDRLTPGHA